MIRSFTNSVSASRQANLNDLIAQLTRAGFSGEPSPLATEIARAKQNANSVVDAALRRDGQALTQLVTSSKAQLDELGKLAEQFAGSDAAKKAQVQTTIAELQRLLPRQIQAARSVLQDPNNKEKQQELSSITNSIK
jgi:hypothetical protein